MPTRCLNIKHGGAQGPRPTVDKREGYITN